MDRPTTRMEADAPGSRLGPVEALILPSRRKALDLCRASSSRSETGSGDLFGPVLLTGEAGAGKTWLWKRLEAEPSASRRWIAVDLTPSDGPNGFYRLIAHELGLVDAGATSRDLTRVELVEALAARSADGLRVNLVIEEAQNLAPELWEEVRVLANRMGRPGGFAAMILVGQTSLAMRFATRPFAAIEARLSCRIHLGPIGVDEAKQLLDHARPGIDWSDLDVETLHRDALGNPGRMLRMVRPAPPLDRPSISEAPALDHRPPFEPDARPASVETGAIARPSLAPAPAIATSSPQPLTGQDRPPIQFEENMIEVGWSPDEESVAGQSATEAAPRLGTRGAIEGGEEAVSDHYAALQAWREWAENQVRPAAGESGPPAQEPVEDEEEEVEDDLDPLPPRPDRPTVRVEGEQKFAPFGQLFSRMVQAIEPD